MYEQYRLWGNKILANNVGIVTICDYQNYGNRLQNYAAQEVMKSLGCQVNTIVNVQKIEIKIKVIKISGNYL